MWLVRLRRQRIDVPLFAFALVSLCLPQIGSASCRAPAQLQASVQKQPSAESYANVGKWFGDRHQYDCATAAFRSALKLDPQSPEISYLLGLSLYSSGRPSEALDFLQRSIQIAPDVFSSRVLMARVLDDLKRIPEAIEQWQVVLKLSSQSPALLDSLSRDFIAQGDYAAVIGLLKSAPQTEDLALDLAQAYGKAGMLDEACTTLTRALSSARSSFRLTNALVTVYVRQRRLQEASQLAGKFSTSHPGDLEAQKLYLRVLVLNNESALAKPLARNLLAVSPHDFYVLFLNGLLERQDGDYPAARKHLEEAVALDQNHAECRYNLGLVLAELNDQRGAKVQLERSIALGYAEPEARFKLAAVLRALGENEQAQKELQAYQKELDANAKRSVAESKSAEAAKQFDDGEMVKAAALYREALDATPNDALLWYKLAVTLDRTGDTAGERAALERAVAVDPTFALAQHQLGYLESISGDSASAERHFRQAVHSAPGYTQAWVSLAAILGTQSRFSEAEEAISTALRLEPNNAQALQLRDELLAAQKAR